MDAHEANKALGELLSKGWTQDARTGDLTAPDGRTISDPSPAELLQLAGGTDILDVAEKRKATARAIDENTVAAAIQKTEELLGAIASRRQIELSDKTWHKPGEPDADGKPTAVDAMALCVTVTGQDSMKLLNVYRQDIEGLARNDLATVQAVAHRIIALLDYQR